MNLRTIYTTDVIAGLELGWGPGWLSPGGSDDVAERELQDAIGPKRARMVAAFGADAADQLTAIARRRAVIVAQGHLRPTHFTARKPG